MPQHVCNGALLTCSFGVAPSQLTVLPVNRVMTSSQPAATIMDHKPMVNVMPFAMCMSLTNPAVAAATSAALGVLTPQPCIPVTVSPWVPGATTVLLGNQPSLDNTCTLNCMWGGIIQVTVPGQFTELIP
ncbi:MAG: DUF4280 domain-containing protein [Nitrosospira sp.]|nr:DUF4280 domain-containing protein [Nitrosospira sp.]